MTSAVSHFISNPRYRDTHYVAVGSSPGDTWAFLRSTSPMTLPWVSAQLAAHDAVDRLFGRLRRRRRSGVRSPQLIAGVGCDHEFPWLAEVPGSEIVTGAVGRFWEPRTGLKLVPSSEFAGFDEPGFGKLAWSLRVHPREFGGTWIAIELRADATDDDAWAELGEYWGIFQKRARVLGRAVRRALVRRLGEAVPESAVELPGDHFIPSSLATRTHAVTIQAPPDAVWPWLAQMGCHRAGWYVFDRLYNGGNRSSSVISGRYQHPHRGDLFAVSSRPGDSVALLELDPGRAFVLGSPALLRRCEHEGARMDLEDEAMTWAFVLSPIGDEGTRLVARLRLDQEVNPLDAAVRPITLAGREVMQRVQLRNLKSRAESLARSRERLRQRAEAPA